MKEPVWISLAALIVFLIIALLFEYFFVMRCKGRCSKNRPIVDASSFAALVSSALVSFLFPIVRKALLQGRGRVIIVAGALSAGKSSMLRQLMPLLDSSYSLVSVDDFVSKIFLEQQTVKIPEEELLKRVIAAVDRMYAKIWDLVVQGNNVIVDTALNSIEGEKSVQYAFDALKDLPLKLVLVHCPLPVLVERIQQGNEKALQDHNLADIRSIALSISQFGHIYRPKGSEGEAVVTVVSRRDVVHACALAQQEFAGDAQRFALFQEQLLTQLGLKEIEEVELTTRLVYDVLVDTSKYTPEECAKQLQESIIKR